MLVVALLPISWAASPMGAPGVLERKSDAKPGLRCEARTETYLKEHEVCTTHVCRGYFPQSYQPQQNPQVLIKLP